jgi:hypothetical protein
MGSLGVEVNILGLQVLLMRVSLKKVTSMEKVNGRKNKS